MRFIESLRRNTSSFSTSHLRWHTSSPKLASVRQRSCRRFARLFMRHLVREQSYRRPNHAMKVISFLLPLIAAALSAGCRTTSQHSDVSSGMTTAAGSKDQFAIALEERMPALLASNKVPGAVVSCIRNGEVAWTKAFGLADLRTSSPMRPNMVLNHGSDGKVLTAWAMMRLVEAGKVELDAPANRYLKRWQIRSTRFDPNSVTPRRLISHTAGLTVHGFNDYK